MDESQPKQHAKSIPIKSIRLTNMRLLLICYSNPVSPPTVQVAAGTHPFMEFHFNKLELVNVNL